MSDVSSENSIAWHLLTLGGLAMLTSPLAALHPWIAGFGAFLFMAIVVSIVALRGSFRATSLIVAVAAILGSGVCWHTGYDLSLSLSLLVSVLGTITLGMLSILICGVSRERLQRIDHLESQQSELDRKSYNEDRKTGLNGERSTFGVSSVADGSHQPEHDAEAAFGQMLSEFVESPSTPVVDPDVFDFAMLLLSMQQIGHRLSSELELDALVSAILGTAREVLRCQHSELHLWNARDGRFSNAVRSERTLAADAVSAVLAETSLPPTTFEWVANHRRILTRRDVAAGKVDDLKQLASELPAAVAPLLVGDDLVGVLVVDRAEDEGPTFFRMLHILANHCSLSLKNAQLFRTIQEMARRDGLTGLLNHAPFLDELERLVDEAQKHHRPLTLVMSDLDSFKDFNDNHGHQAGDKVLQAVADWWRAIMPDHAVLGRYGGEEFICALPGETLDRGFELADMLRSSLESHPVSHSGLQLQVTASFGVAEFGNPATNATRLNRLADKALYRAKSGGRNCVEAHDPSQPEIAALAETTQFSMQTVPDADHAR